MKKSQKSFSPIPQHYAQTYDEINVHNDHKITKNVLLIKNNSLYS